MTEALIQYLDLNKELKQLRKDNKDVFAKESKISDKMMELWWKLNEDEQDRLEPNRIRRSKNAKKSSARKPPLPAVQ